MAYQFVHIDTYAPKPKKIKGTKDQFNSSAQVFGEAERDSRYSSHVTEPLKPVPLMFQGALTVAELRALHDETRAAIRETVTLPNGRTYARGLKSDFPTLYTEIHSHPMRAEDFRRASDDARAEVKDWAKRVLADFLRRMPKGVKFAAVMHLDEGHVHLHILGVNLDDPKLSANRLHVGKQAAEAWRMAHGPAQTLTSLPRPEPIPRPKKPKKPKPSKNRATQKKRDAEHAAAVAKWEEACETVEAANANALTQWETENNAHLRAGRKARKGKTGDVEAFDAAMKTFQDDYYNAVGRPSGLLRDGPRQERLSTKQYDARKKQARAQAATAARLKTREANVIRGEAALAADRAKLAKDTEALQRERQVFERASAKAAGELRAVGAELDAREDELSEGLEAMAGLVVHLERNGALPEGAAPAFLSKAKAQPPARRSRVQTLVLRFASLLKRAATALAGGPELRDEKPEDDGPGW